MRFVTIKNGIMQRINDILGTNDSEVPLTSWSIQSAMLDNMRRIVKGINQISTKGSVPNGLSVSQIGAASILLSTGMGFTVAGNIIMVNVSVTKDLPAGLVATDKVYVYLKYTYAEIAVGQTNSKSSPIISGSDALIAYDEKCSGTTDTTTIAAQINFSVNVEDPSSLSDGVYLGYITVTVTSPLAFTWTATPYHG